MADSGTLSDQELAVELAHYGELIQLPIRSNKKPILLKKLNHLRARAKAQETPPEKGRSRYKSNSNPASAAGVQHRTLGRVGSSRLSSNSAELAEENGTSSTSSDHFESRYRSSRSSSRNLETRYGADNSSRSRGSPPLPPVSSAKNATNHTNPRDRKREPQFPDSILRTLRRRTGEPPLRRGRQNESFEVAADSTDDILNRSQDGSDDEIPIPSPARSRLYPDISRITSYLSRSKDTENAFESSDSDLDETNASTYEVENKSVNTSFPIQGHRASPSTSFNSRDGSRLHALDSSFGSFASSSSSNTPSQRFRSRREPNRVQQYKSWYLESLPQLLVAVAVLFFAGITVTYIATHKDFFLSWFSSSSNMGYGDHILLCSDGLPSAEKKCYGREEVDKSLGYIESMFRDLSIRKGQVLCDSAMPGDDILSVALLETQIDSTAVATTNADRLLRCCLDHILINPHWNIRALRADGTLATTVTEIAKLESNVADMSLWCRLCRSFTQVLYGLFLIAILVLCVFLGSVYLKQKLKQQEAEQREVFTMVEKIIDIVQEHHEQNKGEDSDEPPYLAVQHVRDQLLPPSRRRKLQPIWNKAVEFIAANESRIRLENRLIHGDEFEVWHWLPPSLHNGKIWQGQAFGENNDNNSNQVIYSPTPCLKIRNMFDSNVESEDGWEESVTDAILEKSKHIGNVMHVYVDVDSREGCVYLKCSDCETAGKVRLALHGWWFDGRLVTVKHLKTDHYHKRWPEARTASQPCKPSSDSMRSLSQPYYRSSLEMT
ncbi:inner nuclear membrane protein Man1-like [Elysia marginata]|uniref:Inner nuclear membrane protein Man1-like n=1 Tax=Elysia marginata TaxID=1093978 RepID=A0AAV4EFG9_9GAST|nr:inner nuclear membrane protein Man1-like [Elysia marginata]